MSEDEKREYKKITEEELIRVLEEHEKWLKWEDLSDEKGPGAMEKGEKADIEGLDLREFGDVLKGYNLNQAILRSTNLEGTNLEGADLVGAHLGQANLEGANHSNAHLEGAFLGRANLRGALLSGAHLKGAKLFEAILEGANFHRASLDGANFERANLEGVLLLMANLKGAKFEWVNLKRANLSMANLKGAELWEADLQGSELIVANLEQTQLGSANLKGVDLSESNLEGANVARVKYDRKMKFRGCRISNCVGSPRFRAFALHQDFIEELMEGTRWERFLCGVWNLFADCGRTPWRWVLWSVLFSLSFGFGYYLLGSESFDVGHLYPEEPWTYVYYSVVTFTTLGFGDIVPKTQIAATLVMMEVILGYVMLGGLISIFAMLITPRR